MKAISNTTLGILALWLIPGIGPKRIYRLWEHYHSTDQIFNASPRHLAELLGMTTDQTAAIPAAPESAELKIELELITASQVRLCDFTEPDYPASLRQIHNAPPILYQKGEHDLNTGFHLAFVGSRKASFYGRNNCKKLIEQLSVLSSDIVIVSGLALGIDTVAHATALDCGLKSVAVLGNGLSNVYPAKNKKLAKEIEDQGCLLSEFPMSAQPIASNFPLRNRIISGLSKGVVIIEAGERSGATITGGYALEQNRELFALPGPVDSSYFKGTNRLIQRSQAKLIMEAKDILEEFSLIDKQLSFEELPKQDHAENASLSSDEREILNLIRLGTCQKDQLIEQTEFPVSALLTILTSLELKGLIIGKPGALYEAIEP